MITLADERTHTSEHCEPTIPTMKCADNIEYLRNFRDGFFKLIVTSPPYNIGKNYKAKASGDGDPGAV